MKTKRSVKLPSGLPAAGQRRHWQSSRKIKLIGLSFVGTCLLGYLFLVRPAIALVAAAQDTRTQAQALLSLAKEQNLDGVRGNLPQLQSSLIRLERDLGRLSWLRVVPIVSAYWRDAGHLVQVGQHGVEAGVIIVETLAPYADILGLKGGSAFSELTAESRIQTVVSTLDKVMPEIDRFGAKIGLIKADLDQIDPHRYPTQIKGKLIRGQLERAKTQVASIEELFVQTSPLIRVLPVILGQSEPKKYLVLFQNDAEIRPTGGFLTAYAIFVVDKGKIRAEKSEDIYVLDASVTKVFPLPEPIKLSPLGVSSWHLRDANLSPDFKVAMDQFKEMYQYATRGQKVDGIIAIDTAVLVDALRVLGPVSAYGIDFTVANEPLCNCPQVIYELEKVVDTPVAFERSGRKDILGVLMLAIMQKGLQSSPSHVWPQMLQALLTDLKEKHLLLSFNDPKLQEAVEKVGFAGRILPFSGDYLHINDTNFGGAKSNLFIEEKVSQDYQIREDGKLLKTVTVEYLNPYPWSDCNLESGDLCLNGEAPIWVRVYVPQGSELIESSGSSRAVVGQDELEKTFFAGWLSVRPEGTAYFTVSYLLPVAKDHSVTLLIQKQPGKKEVVHQIKLNGQVKQSYQVRQDLEVKVDLE